MRQNNYQKAFGILVLLLFLADITGAATTIGTVETKWVKNFGSQINSVAISETGNRVYAGTAGGEVRAYSDSGSLLWNWTTNYSAAVSRVLTNKDGSLVAVMDNNQTIYVISGNTGATSWSRYIHPGTFGTLSDLDLAPHSDHVLATTTFGLFLWNGSGSYLGYRPTQSGTFYQSAISGDGDWLVSSRSASTWLGLYHRVTTPESLIKTEENSTWRDTWVDLRRVPQDIPPDWLAGYSKRLTFNISSGTSDTVSDYTTAITFYKSLGSPSNGIIYLGADVQDDFDDVRITTDAGEEIPSYRYSYTSGSTATVYFKFPTMGPTTAPTTYHLYYGNPSATSNSSWESILYSRIVTNWNMEDATGWTYTEYDPANRVSGTLPSSGWSSVGSNSMYFVGASSGDYPWNGEYTTSANFPVISGENSLAYRLTYDLYGSLDQYGYVHGHVITDGSNIIETMSNVGSWTHRITPTPVSPGSHTLAFQISKDTSSAWGGWYYVDNVGFIKAGYTPTYTYIQDPYYQWAYLDYLFRKPLTISSGSSDIVSNYTVYITGNTGAGTDSGTTIYFNNKGQSNCYDVRFTDQNGFPIAQEKIPGSCAWYVKFPVLGPTSAPSTYYVYYGHKYGSETGDGSFPYLAARIQCTPGDPSMESATNWAYWETDGGSAIVGIMPDNTWSTRGTSSGSIKVTSTSTVTANGNWGPTSSSTPYLINVGPVTGESTLAYKVYWDAKFNDVGNSQGTVTVDGAVRATYTSTSTWTDENYQFSPGTTRNFYWTFTKAADNEQNAQIWLDDVWCIKAGYTPALSWTDQSQMITYIDYDTSATLTGNIVTMDSPESGSWVGIQTTAPRIYHQPINDVSDPYSFGTAYYATSTTGNAYGVAVADSAAFSIEGRNLIVDIYRIDAVKVGTYTTGGSITTVDISQKNGLWAAAGSTDGQVYIFSKESASSWYFYWSSDALEPVTAIAMSWRGEYVVAGRSDGTLALYYTGGQATGSYQFHVFKVGVPWKGSVEVWSGGTDQSAWTLYARGSTDDYGAFSVPLTPGVYYKIVLIGEDAERIILASAARTEYTITIEPSYPVQIDVNYYSTWSNETSKIWLYYNDTTNKTTNVNFKVYRSRDNELIYNETLVPENGVITAGVNITQKNTSYRVKMTATKDSQTFSNTWHQSVGMGVAPLPEFLDENTIKGIWWFVILFLGGLFSYLGGPEGAVVTSVFAGGLVLMGWLPIPVPTVVMVIVWAFLGLFGRKSGEI